MIAAINPSVISGTIHAPASKSIMQRACALALLNHGHTHIIHPGYSDDDKAALGIIREMGATVVASEDGWHVYSDGIVRASKNIQCDESGLSARMFTAIAALAAGESVIHGSGTLLKRSFHFFEHFFPGVDVAFQSSAGYLPLRLSGPMQPHDISIDASSSSQYLTGILFAFASSAKKQLTISVSNLVSRPYIDLSITMMKSFGYDISHEQYVKFYISPIKDVNQDITYQIESDWSSGAMLLVAGAIAGKKLIVSGLKASTAQADVRIIGVLQSAGAGIQVTDDGLVVEGGLPLQAFEVNSTDCPDLFPPLVALATACKGTSVIYGVSRLAGKESNRAETLMDVFTKLGVDMHLQDDAMHITGCGQISGGRVSSHSDHRIAMAVTIAALHGKGAVHIDDAGVVDKSYPDFYKHLTALGANITLHQS